MKFYENHTSTSERGCKRRARSHMRSGLGSTMILVMLSRSSAFTKRMLVVSAFRPLSSVNSRRGRLHPDWHPLQQQQQQQQKCKSAFGKSNIRFASTLDEADLVLEEDNFDAGDDSFIARIASTVAGPGESPSATLPSIDDLTNAESPFEVTAEFEPTGDQPEAIRKLLQQLRGGNHPNIKGSRFSVLRGITGTGKTLVMSHLIAKHGKPTLVLCHNKTLAAQLARELRSFLGNNAVELFVSYYNHYVPESYNEVTGNYVAKKSSINSDIDAMRHRATRALLTRNDVVIVASVSCIYGLGLPQEYLDASTSLTVGDDISSPEDFMGILNTMLYQHEALDDDFERGKYHAAEVSSTQWNIALWPPHESFPLRIELEQEDAREDGRWVIGCLEQGHAGGHDPISTFCLMPAKHHVMAEDQVERACLAIEEECEQRVKELVTEGKSEEADRLQQRVTNDMLVMRETGFCSGAENYSRHLAAREPGEAPATLMDYFDINGREWTLMIDESHVTLPQLRAMYGGDQARKRRLVKHGYRLPSALDNRPLKEEEFWERVRQCVFVSATPSTREIELSEHDPVEMVVRPTFVCDPEIEVRSKEGQLDDLANEIRTRAMRQERTLAVTLTKRDAEDLADFLNEQGIASAFIHSGLNTQERAEALSSLQNGDVNCLVGVALLREGLDLPQVSLVAILNADMEGFLRSETALLQMVGRAARNVEGKAILYANQITKSMKKCMDATDCRRRKQLSYNLDNNCMMKSTKGSSMMSIFDLLKDQIAEEQPLEVVGRRVVSSGTLGANQPRQMNVLCPDMTVRIKEKKSDVTTDHIPAKPGVYFWKDGAGKILYIGKAKKLRSRVRSYLSPSAKHSKRIEVMIEKADSIDFILTKSDREALLLESNLIKYHQPPYNVLLKDDQSYPYICASIGDSFPRLSVVPRRYEDSQKSRKYRYFGPYPHYIEINAILDGIEAKYDLRAKSFMARHGAEEINQIGYQNLFQQVLDENFDSLQLLPEKGLAELRSKYEEAGLLFDPEINHSRDVVAIAKVPSASDGAAVVHLVQFRDGLITNRYSYDVTLPAGTGNEEEDFAAAIQQVLERLHYPSGEESPGNRFSFFPEELLVQHLCDDTRELRQVIRSSRKTGEPTSRKGKVKNVVKSPVKRGPKKQGDQRAMEVAVENAKQVAYERSLEDIRDATKTSVDGTALTELAALLNLDKEPTRIECYDISHSQGEFPVASRVVFVGGRPVKELYRKFNIKTVDGVDDYASLEETLSRRFKRAWMNGEGGPVDSDDPWSLPDLVLIDGGPGQLSAAAKGMAKAQVFPAERHGKTKSSAVSGEGRSATVNLCSLAKNHEELFVYGTPMPVNNSPDTPALLLLRALRDESHRFALTGHRSRRSLKKST